jgi:hypothetical protein
MTSLFLGIALLGVALASRVLKVDNSTVFGSLFFAPIIAYLVFSGQLSEFKGFGVEAKLREVGSSPIKLVSGTIEPSLRGTKHGEARTFLGGGSAVVVLDVDEATKYSADPLPLAFRVAEEISANLLQGQFELLVAVDRQGVLLGSLRKSWFLDILSIPDVHISRANDPDYEYSDKKRMRQHLGKTLLWDILLKPQERTKDWGLTASIRRSSTQIDALRELYRHRAEALPVVDTDGKYQGIVRRADLESALIEPLLSLAIQGKG